MYDYGTIGSGKGLSISRVPAPPEAAREYVILFPTQVLLRELWRRLVTWLKRATKYE